MYKVDLPSLVNLDLEILMDHQWSKTLFYLRMYWRLEELSHMITLLSLEFLIASSNS